MYRIIDKSSTGKTSNLLLLAKEQNGIVICENPNAMRQKAERYGIVGLDFISYVDFVNETYAINKPVFIDEIEILFKKMYGAVLAGYTMTVD